MSLGNSWLSTCSTFLKMKFKLFLQTSQRFQQIGSDQRGPCNVSQIFALSSQTKSPQVPPGSSICQTRAPKYSSIVFNGINDANSKLQQRFSSFTHVPQPERFQIGPHRKNLICNIFNQGWEFGFSKDKWHLEPKNQPIFTINISSVQVDKEVSEYQTAMENQNVFIYKSL